MSALCYRGKLNTRARSAVIVLLSALALTAGAARAQRRASGVQTSFATEKPIRRPVRFTPTVLREIADAVPDIARECDGDIAGSVSASRIDLNRDGRPDLVLQGAMSCTRGTHTVGFWLLTGTAGGYKLAFHHYEDALSIRPTVTNGYHDLSVVGTTRAGSEISEWVLKFDGSKYKTAVCWLTDMSEDRKRHRVACPRDE